MRKSREGASHPDRNAQFEHINSKADEFLQRGKPVVSVDTKKKSWWGISRTLAGSGNRRAPLRSHWFTLSQDAAGKAIPYGIYDMGGNEAWVSAGCDHDTPAFAVASLRRWWEEMGKSRYREARELYITADAGGSNGYRLRAWKHELQRFADETGVRVHVSHFPPAPASGTRLSIACSVTSRTMARPAAANLRDHC